LSIGSTEPTGRPDIISLLLASGASIDARDHYGSTALHVACQFNKTAAVHILLEHGADDTVQDNFGATPLQRCKDFGHSECERALVRWKIAR
jgi:ankyrin repeat protein